MKKPKHNPRPKAAYLEVVENQLRDNDPPETRHTLTRLKRMGISEQDAKLLIASAIAAETYWIMKNGQSFNRDRFIRNLHLLPEQDFDAE